MQNASSMCNRSASGFVRRIVKKRSVQVLSSGASQRSALRERRCVVCVLLLCGVCVRGRVVVA